MLYSAIGFDNKVLVASRASAASTMHSVDRGPWPLGSEGAVRWEREQGRGSARPRGFGSRRRQ